MGFSIRRLLFAALLAVLASSALAQDYAREKRWADEVVPGLVVGDAVMIRAASGHGFLGIYTEVKDARAAIVLVHGLGVHPDHSIIGALRTRLADLGYTTLAIQMPVAAADAPQEAYPPMFADAADRIAKAADWLKARGAGKVVLLSHSMGSWMANSYLDGAYQTTPYRAWVALGLGHPYSASMARYNLPILDVYGEQDLPAVRETGAQRSAALDPLSHSRQVMVAGSDHFYNGHEAELAATIDIFLRANLK
jgi:alpha/beta superfamily hydrolase